MAAMWLAFRALTAATLILSLASGATADLYGGGDDPSDPTTAPPPPFAVAGKQFPPESTTCPANTACSGQTLSCPNQCPEQKPADPNAKGCFLDCNNPTCESGTCKNRKPNCNGNGAACFDPRFIGGDGVVFFFHGEAGRHFALISDRTFQINAGFIGRRRPAGRNRDFTWIQSLGILFSRHSFTVEAIKTASWSDSVDRLAFSYDGRAIAVEEGYLSSWTSGAGVEVERLAAANSVAVAMPGVFEVKVTVVPVTPEDDRVHRYGVPAGDCFAHLEVQFELFKLSGDVDGVLGRTYRPGFVSPVKKGVAMPVMGGEEEFAVGSLVSGGCKKCVFSPEDINGGESWSSELALASGSMDCNSGGGGGGGVVCRRR